MTACIGEISYWMIITIGVDLAGILGGRMVSAESGSVPSGVGMGRGVPRSRLEGLMRSDNKHVVPC